MNTAADTAAQTAAHAAATRLDQSRGRLRQALLGEGGAAGQGAGQPSASTMPAWLATLKGLPGVGLLIDALEGWWARHPLHVAGVIAATTADAVLEPVAQDHPWRLVLGAAALGGLLAWSRPWRWLVVPAVFAGLVPQLLSTALQAPPAGVGPPLPR